MRNRISLIMIVMLSAVTVLPVIGPAASAAGGPVGSDFVIRNDPETEVHPAVAYNDQRQEYLVVWYNDRPGNDDVRGQRVAKDGRLVGGPFYISAGPGAERRYPDVAYNSQRNEYLVVWEHYDSAAGSSIHARRVSATGQPLEPPDIVVRSSGYNLYTPARPAVAYASTSDKYLVVWEETWHPIPIPRGIEGQVLSSAGALEGGSFTISQDPGGAPREEPDVAYNRSRNEYLVVWRQKDPGPGDYDIYARRVQGSGPPMYPESIEIRRGGGDQNAPAVAAIPTVPNQGQYLVVWEDRWIPSDGDIHARRVTGEGNPLDYPYFEISKPTDDQTKPAVAGSESGDQYLVIWTHDYALLANFAIHGRAVSMGAALLGEEVAIGGLFADHAAVAGGWLGDFLVAFDDPGFFGDTGIYGQLWGNRVYLPVVLKSYP